MANSEQTSLPSRREFLQGGVAAGGMALASTKLALAMPEETAKRPNMIFVFTEGQRSDALGIAGHPFLKTPHMDRIAKEGAWFRNAFCTNSLCAPARAVALTGLYSHTSGALDNRLAHVPLPADMPFFTDLLHQAGYEVAMMGKAHVRNGAKERYWDYYFGFNAAMTNYYQPRFAEGRDGKIGEEKVYDGYADDVVTDKALEWLSQKREKPFCLLLWYQTPHAPFYRARRHLDLYSGMTIAKPATFDDDLKGYPGKPSFTETDNKIGTVDNLNATRSLEEVVKDYCAGLTAIDENIGRVFHWLDESKKTDDTAIVLSADHGFFLGEWRLYDKRFMHEPSIRVPTMIRYPKRVKSGTIVDEMALDVDLAPTFLDLAGIPAPTKMQGKSLMKLAGGDAEGWRKDWLYHYYEYPKPSFVQPHYGIRTEQYKLIYYYQTKKGELYDLHQDPGEIRNLYDLPEHSALQAKLHQRLTELRKELGDTDQAAS